MKIKERVFKEHINRILSIRKRESGKTGPEIIDLEEDDPEENGAGSSASAESGNVGTGSIGSGSGEKGSGRGGSAGSGNVGTGSFGTGSGEKGSGRGGSAEIDSVRSDNVGSSKTGKEKTGKGKPRKPNIKKILLRILIAFCILVVAAVIAGGIYIFIQITKAPDISTIDATPDGYITTILDKDGNKTDSLYKTESNRIYVTLDQTPVYLQEAFIAIEDSRFYKHNGIDIKGILRAAFKGITTGNFSEGASTITQQLLKNNVFTEWMSEDTFSDRLSRKIQEQYLAVCLEKQYSKEWILENYMNTINLGGGTRGVEVAAQYYYGKDVSELTLAESALIAGITKNPSAYNPLKDAEASVKRQHLVLDAMEAQGYITEEEHTAALAEDVIGDLVTDHSQIQIFSWFEDALLNSVVEDLEEEYNYTEEEAWDKVYSGGLTIYSTENTALQEICDECVTTSENIPENSQVSVVMTDVQTGAVAAIIGGKETKEASLTYDRAISAIRQPGSTIKIIGEYAAGLELGNLTLGTVYDDAPYTYSDGTAIHNAELTYGGMTTVRSAIETSCNVVALKAFQQSGQEEVISFLNKFGITTLDENDYYESLAIGGTYNGVTNLEMTAAYNAIAADGVYIKPYYYTKVVDHNGDTILANDTEGTKIISSTTAELLTLAMEDVLENGTGKAAQITSAEAAGKSGTTNDNKDLWFIGFTSNYTCGIWGGCDDNSAQESGKYVKQLWHDIMQKANAEIPDARSVKLVDTDTLVSEGKLTSAEICTKCGKLAVSGLCTKTLQGNMTETEYYTPGTEPTEYCDCHIQLTICKESGKEVSEYCPYTCRKTSVYLKTGTAGTDDEEYSAADLIGTTCDIHTSIWDKIFNGGGDESGDDADGNGSGTGNGSGNGSGTGNGSNGGSGSGTGNGSNGGSGSGTGNNNGDGSGFFDGIGEFFNGLFQ